MTATSEEMATVECMLQHEAGGLKEQPAHCWRQAR
jgi:hypothetical protein